MSGTVAFIQECLTTDREKRSHRNLCTSCYDSQSAPHSLQERQWVPLREGREGDAPLALAWDPSERYFAEGSEKGFVTVWSVEENTFPHHCFDRPSNISFRLKCHTDCDKNAKSASLAWSNCSHFLFMASNYHSTCHDQDAIGGNEPSPAEKVCELAQWQMEEKELPLASSSLPFEVQSILPLPSSCLYKIVAVSLTGQCFFLDNSLIPASVLSFSSEVQLQNLKEIAMLPFSHSVIVGNPAVRVLAASSKVHIVACPNEKSILLLLCMANSCCLVEFDVLSFGIIRKEIVNVCEDVFVPGGSCVGSLSVCHSKSEIILSFSEPISSKNCIQVRSLTSLQLIQDFSDYFSSPDIFREYALQSKVLAIDERNLWKDQVAGDDNSSCFEIVGAGFITSTRQSTNRFAAVCFNLYPNRSSSSVSSQWVCYISIGDKRASPDHSSPLQPEDSSFFLKRIPLKFRQWHTSLRSSCLLGMQSRDGEAQDFRPLVFYSPDETLNSYFAGANFPPGFVVLDRSQRYIEQEDETDLVVPNPAEGRAPPSEGDMSGRKRAHGGEIDGEGASNKRSKGFDVVDIWSSGSELRVPCLPGERYEDIDEQGAELESYLLQELNVDREWTLRGGWKARALPVVSQFASNSVSTFAVSTGEVKSAEETSDVSPRSQALDGQANFPLKQECSTKRTTHAFSSKNAVPIRVLAPSQNIVARASRNAQINRRISETIIKSFDRTREIKERISRVVAKERKAKVEQKELKMQAQQVKSVMDYLISVVETANSGS